MKRAMSRANGTKFGRPRKVKEVDHIATAKRMKADGHTGKDIAKYLGVSRATLPVVSLLPADAPVIAAGVMAFQGFHDDAVEAVYRSVFQYCFSANTGTCRPNWPAR